MPLNYEKMLTLALILPVFIVVSRNIMTSASIIHVKSDRGMLDSIVACVTTVLCCIKVCDSWLKMLFILAQNDAEEEKSSDKRKIILVHKLWEGNNDNTDSKAKTETPVEPPTTTPATSTTTTTTTPATAATTTTTPPPPPPSSTACEIA
jgi:hypothetical protein